MTTFRFILLFILLLIPTAASGERTALHEAAAASQADEVTRLLKAGADVEARDRFGQTALHEAASKGHLGIVKVLLEHGADVEARNEGGETALHEVASKGHLGIVKVLLEHGADVEARAMMGRTPRDVATRKAIIHLLDQATNKETP